MSETRKYYGIFNPENPELSVVVDCKTEALSLCKKSGSEARFKCFDNENDAIAFSKEGCDKDEKKGNSYADSALQLLDVKHSPVFKSVNTSELAQFRTLIEKNDFKRIKEMIWEMPGYLISGNDTPTLHRIYQYRYNALHFAATYDSKDAARIILKALSDESFYDLIYKQCESYVERREILLDMYLNQPDKRDGQTPLHLASKFGCVDTIRVFLSYSQVYLDPLDKNGQTPLQICCSKYNGPGVDDRKEKITAILEKPSFIFVYESDCIPIVEKPVTISEATRSPKHRQHQKRNPADGSWEKRAVFGPMSPGDAAELHATLKSHTSPVSPYNKSSPKSSPSLTPTASGCSGKVGASPLARVEAVSRDLAKQFEAPLCEYWSFLDRWVDFSSEDGLLELEEYLRGKMEKDIDEYFEKESDFSSELCRAFHALRLAENDDATFRVPSPPMFFENRLCKKIADKLTDILLATRALDDKCRRLRQVLSRCLRDFSYLRRVRRSEYVPARKIHLRIAQMTRVRLFALGEKVCGGLLLTAISEHLKAAAIKNAKRNPPDVGNALTCLVTSAIDAFPDEELDFEDAEAGFEIWARIGFCSCYAVGKGEKDSEELLDDGDDDDKEMGVIFIQGDSISEVDVNVWKTVESLNLTNYPSVSEWGKWVRRKISENLSSLF